MPAGALCLLFSSIFLAPVCYADEYSNLNNIMNQVDKPQDWSHANPGTSYYQAPPTTPTPQAFARPTYNSYARPAYNGPAYNSYMRPGMPYSSASISALQHSPIWKYMAKPAYAGPMAGQPGGNPFNLSPFGMLHYMWDDTNYVSDANPVTLYQTQSELQSAQQFSQMAQAASTRARYARNPQERAEAAQQAQYYANQAKMAAQQAQQVSESGSLNPAEVAQAAVQQAQSAQNFASQANNYAQRGW